MEVWVKTCEHICSRGCKDFPVVLIRLNETESVKEKAVKPSEEGFGFCQLRSPFRSGCIHGSNQLPLLADVIRQWHKDFFQFFSVDVRHANDLSGKPVNLKAS